MFISQDVATYISIVMVGGLQEVSKSMVESWCVLSRKETTKLFSPRLLEFLITFEEEILLSASWSVTKTYSNLPFYVKVKLNYSMGNEFNH